MGDRPMRTKIRNEDGCTIVSLEGTMSFEDQVPLKDEIEAATRPNVNAAPKRVIFNLEDLDFVGSSGISGFIKTLAAVSEKPGVQSRYCNVKSEFRRIMKAMDEFETFEFFDSEETAKKSYLDN